MKNLRSNQQLWIENFLSPSKPSFDTGEAADQIARAGVKWGEPAFGTKAEVTYSFLENPAPDHQEQNEFIRFTEMQMLSAKTALQAWSDVANIQFTRIGSGFSGEEAYSSEGQIKFEGFTRSESGAAGMSGFPVEDNVTVSVLMGRESDGPHNWIYDGNEFSGRYSLLLHEIGHAIGLSHPSPITQLPASYETMAVYREDVEQFSIMSYFGAERPEGTAKWVGPTTPMMHDIAAAQLLYGPNLETRTDDTVYGFNSNADRDYFQITHPSQHVKFCVWDAGGNDTFDFSEYLGNKVIDLREGHLSTVGPSGELNPIAIWNVSIAVGAVIENAIGGLSAEIIYGNTTSNRLIGNGGNDEIFGFAGNDLLDGGDGIDTAIFEDKLSDAHVSLQGEYLVVLTARGGIDRLTNIEVLEFADGNFTIDEALAFSQDDYRLIASSGFSGSIAGSGVIVGSPGIQNMSVGGTANKISFDASFNGGGDRIFLEGEAHIWNAQLVGSRVELSAENTVVSIPVGLHGTDLIFADGARSLKVDAISNQVAIGDQVITQFSASIEALSADVQNDQPAETNAIAKLVLMESADVELSGNFDIVGTQGHEAIALAKNLGAYEFDASFNQGGDNIFLSQSRNEFDIYLTGSRVVFESPMSTLSIPVGSIGLKISFVDMDLLLIVDTVSGEVLLGDEIIRPLPDMLANEQGSASVALTAQYSHFQDFLPSVSSEDLSFPFDARTEEFWLDDETISPSDYMLANDNNAGTLALITEVSPSIEPTTDTLIFA